jgi:predicted metal-dependent phosphoesterase TrpH
VTVRAADHGRPANGRSARALRRCDLHLHTRHSRWKHLRVIRARDSYTDPLMAFDRARAAGMDFVAFTDHESIDGALRVLETRPDRAGEVIIGEEIETRFPETGQWLHVSAFGLDEARHREIQRLRPDVRALVAYLRSERLLYVLNHPFQSFHFQVPARAYAEEILELFGHVETGNATMSVAHQAAATALLGLAAAAGRPLVAVAGSDAHVPDHIGSAWTEAPGATAAEFLASVACGDCTWSCRPIGFVRLVSHVHRAIGRYYLEALAPAGCGAASGAPDLTLMNRLTGMALIPGTLLGVPALLTALNRLRQEVVSRLVRQGLEAAIAELEAAGFGAAVPAESVAPAEAAD